MIPKLNPLQEALLDLTRSYGRLGSAAWIIPDAAMLHGQSFELASPHDYELMKPKECFRNAALGVHLYEGFQYAEGFAACSDLLVPVHHAWNVDSNGNAVDLTLRRVPGAVYYYQGIVIPDIWQRLGEHFGAFEATDFIHQLGYPSTQWLK